MICSAQKQKHASRYEFHFVDRCAKFVPEETIGDDDRFEPTLSVVVDLSDSPIGKEPWRRDSFSTAVSAERNAKNSTITRKWLTILCSAYLAHYGGCFDVQKSFRIKVVDVVQHGMQYSSHNITLFCGLGDVRSFRQKNTWVHKNFWYCCHQAHVVFFFSLSLKNEHLNPIRHNEICSESQTIKERAR